MKSKLSFHTLIAMLFALALLVACGGNPPEVVPADESAEPAVEPTDVPPTEAPEEGSDSSEQEEAEMEEEEEEEEMMEEVEVVTVGPNGETATPSEEVQLTADEAAQVQDGGYTAALLWHTSAAFTEAVSQGARDAFAELGIEIVAETNAGFDSAKQASDIETVLALEPDIILSLVLDPVSGAQAFRPAVDSGVQLVFLSNVPEGYVHGEDYVGTVTDDLAGMGIAAAELLGDAMGGSGQVGYIFHDAAYYVTNQRDQGFKAWIEATYPDIEIVAEEGMADPARAEEIAAAMLTRNPDITGIYTPWAGPADGVLAALRAAGRDDVKVVTLDLDTNVALDMVEGGNMAGIAADLAYELGRTMAVEGAYGLLDKPAPAFTIVPAIKVTADNIAEAWQQSLAQEAPAEVLEALGIEPAMADETEEGAMDDELMPADVGVVTIGPGGETATASSEVQLTADEVAQAQEGGYTAALLWHTSAAFTEAVSQGARDAFAELGIEIVAETNAGFDSAKQASDIETVLALEPDIILSLVLDPVSGAQAFQPAVDSGVQLVFLSNVPEGYVQGEDYVGIVTDDLAGMGIAAAELLGDAMGGSGQVGYIFHDAAYYVTNQRDQGFKAWIEAKYPDIEIVAEEGMADPARAEEIAAAMLTRNPDITGIYTPWAGPADGVLAALRAAGRDDVKVVTLDLDTNVALDMVEGGNMAGIAADLAYELGRTMAVEGVYGLLDKPAPAFTVVPAIKVTADNVAEAWQESLAQDAPAEVLDALNK